ncbi:hypothetical protein DFH09DRAFT_1218692 [Mycena vulgaris]|nr:hypothetical protein DFH09DRAFT_1218692 [Mycena vulgaris]
MRRGRARVERGACGLLLPPLLCCCRTTAAMGGTMEGSACVSRRLRALSKMGRNAAPMEGRDWVLRRLRPDELAGRSIESASSAGLKILESRRRRCCCF